MIYRRTATGASIVLVLASLIVLAVAAVGAVMLINMFTGGEQTQRAADVGNLGLARSALVGINYNLPLKGAQEQFNGIADPSTNGINLRNINRVMAQSFLVSLNAKQMADDGADNGATSDAKQVADAAQLVANGLTAQLSSAGQLSQFFNALAAQDPTGELTGKGTLSATGTPSFSYMERGDVSNISITAKQMPDYDPSTGQSSMWNNNNGSWTASAPGPGGSSGNFFFGYKDGITPSQNDSTFPNTYFLPLHPMAQAHLVSSSDFAANSNPSAGSNSFNWQKPVPNAISLSGQAVSAVDSKTSNWTAFAIVEPLDQVFQASIPHGFIRLENGPPSAASGAAAGSKDVFVYVMNDPQFYPTSKGKALPYFIGVNDTNDTVKYLQDIVDANKAGKKPDCSALSVGVQVTSKDTIGLGGVDQANCGAIDGFGPVVGGAPTPIDNTDSQSGLDDPGSVANQDMKNAGYGTGDPRGLDARPPIEAAYNIPPAQATGSNGASVHVANIVNLSMLSQRATGADATFTTSQSGVATLPGGRSSLASPNFMVTTDSGARLQFDPTPGAPTYPIYKAMVQRIYEIYPNWDGNLSALLGQNYVPMGGQAFIYYSANAKGMVLKAASDAVADAPWLKDFMGQAPDGKTPPHPTAITQTGPLDDKIYDVSGDWGFPHPYDDESPMCIATWFAWTPSSGYNNLLGVVNMGAVNTNCCPGVTQTQNVNINYSASGDTVTIPTDCQCENTGGCKHSGPC